MSNDDDLLQLAQRGIALCRQGEWEKGAVCLKEVAAGSGEAGALPEGFYSYLGCRVAGLEGHNKEGIELCQKAIELEFYHPDNYLNLARIYYATERLGPALEAVGKGLQLDSENRDLIELRARFEARKPPVLPFLKRQHPVNRVLGKIRHDASGHKTD